MYTKKMNTIKRSRESTPTGRPNTRQRSNENSAQKHADKWTNSLGNLFAKPYFLSCRNPRQFNYPDYLQWTKQHSLNRAQARQFWNNAISFMTFQNHKALKEAALKMKNDKDSNTHGAFEDSFFASKKFDDRLQEKRQALIEEIDTYITDSQRQRFLNKPSATAGSSSMSSHAPTTLAADTGSNYLSSSPSKADTRSSSTSLPTVGPSSMADPPLSSSPPLVSSLSRSSSPAPPIETTAKEYVPVSLTRKHLTSSKKAYQRYMKSLLAIRDKTAVDDQVQDLAGDILRTRESSFRTDYFYVDSQLQQDAANARKHSLVEAHEEEPSHLALHFNLVSNGSVDGDFQSGDKNSETNSKATLDENLTGEIPEPIEMDRLVGQGEFSSQLSAEGHLVIGDCDISMTVMKHRRSVIRQPTLTEVDYLLLTNFIVSRSLLLKLFPAEKVNEAFPSHNPVALNPAELGLVGRLSARATAYSYDDIQQWFDQQPRLTNSIVHRILSSYFWDAGLWSDCNWFKKGTGDGEDTFTHTLIKPLLAGAFGDLAGCSFRWGCDLLRSGKSEDPGARLQLPDYQVSIGEHTIVLGEFKTAMAPLKAMQDDYVKLGFMGKKAVDGLYKTGFPALGILIHGR
ncbi:hypothetical protein BGZ79_011164, partial [Entomortierella chlamydospora]